MLLTETCYYTENQGFGGATNRDMSLNETCLYTRLYGMYIKLSFLDKMYSNRPQCSAAAGNANRSGAVIVDLLDSSFHNHATDSR